jgi:hypothetical protein
MQNKSRQLSIFRQKLMQFPDLPRQALSPFLSSSPMTKGTVYALRRKCSKSHCRCAKGELHTSLVLTASISGKTKLWTIDKAQFERLRQSTAEYRRFRQARSCFLKEYARRKNEILRVIDAIGKIRTQRP